VIAARLTVIIWYLPQSDRGRLVPQHNRRNIEAA
jgi:hypothetical protein